MVFNYNLYLPGVCLSKRRGFSRKPSSWRHPGGTVSETEETDFRNFFKLFKTFSNFFKHFTIFANICKPFQTFLNIFKHFQTFLNIFKYVQTFSNIFKHF